MFGPNKLETEGLTQHFGSHMQPLTVTSRWFAHLSGDLRELPLSNVEPIELLFSVLPEISSSTFSGHECIRTTCVCISYISAERESQSSPLQEVLVLFEEQIEGRTLLQDFPHGTPGALMIKIVLRDASSTFVSLLHTYTYTKVIH